ncbi:MAG: hypothetical protein WB777_07325 [Mycobacterium sp.]
MRLLIPSASPAAKSVVWTAWCTHPKAPDSNRSIINRRRRRGSPLADATDTGNTIACDNWAPVVPSSSERKGKFTLVRRPAGELCVQPAFSARFK